MANGTGQVTRGQLKHDQGHDDDTSPWRPRKIPCVTNRSEEIERHSHGPHLAAMGSSLGGACRETAPALGTASSGMRSPCLPSLLTVRVARQTNHYGCELGWGGGILVRALLPGGDCRRVPYSPSRLGPISTRYPTTDHHPSTASSLHETYSTVCAKQKCGRWVAILYL